MRVTVSIVVSTCSVKPIKAHSGLRTISGVIFDSGATSALSSRFEKLLRTIISAHTATATIMAAAPP